MTIAKHEATVEDLYNAPDDGYKYELVNGELKRMPPTGELPGKIASRIATALEAYEEQTGYGVGYADGPGYLVNLPHRHSISPDASFTRSFDPANMGFIKGFPIFAVEVRSQSDYSPTRNREYAEKRGDYFAIGTEVVWDVAPVKRTVTKYTRGQDAPVTWGAGADADADAEPALPGWRMPVARLFRPVGPLRGDGGHGTM